MVDKQFKKIEALQKMGRYMTAGGLFKSNLQMNSGTLVNTRLALLMVERFGYDTAVAESVIAKVMQKLPSGTGVTDTDPTMLAGLLKSSSKTPRISPHRLTVIAESLIPLLHTTNARGFLAWESSILLSELYRTTQPMYFHLTTVAFQISKKLKNKIELQPLNLLGMSSRYIKAAVVEAVSLADSDTLKNILPIGEVLNMDISKNNTALLLLSKEVENLMSPGRYIFSFSVTFEGLQVSTKVDKTILITSNSKSSYVISNVGVAVGPEKAITVSSPMGYQRSDSANVNQTITMTFTLNAMLPKSSKIKFKKPSQAIISFTLVDANGVRSETARTPVFKTTFEGVDKLNRGLFKCTIKLRDEISYSFDYIGGDYLASILVADMTLKEPIRFNIGIVSLEFAEKTEKHFPLYKRSILYQSDTTLKALPTMQHVMTAPDIRASTDIAAVFSVLVVLPLLALVFFYSSLKIAVPKHPSGVLYLSSIGSVLVLYAAYWLGLPGVSFYNTLRMLCVLIPMVIVTGFFAVEKAHTLKLLRVV